VPYKITYEPVNRIMGVTAKTVERQTAAEAWALVQSLNASDERTIIRDASGKEVGWQELRAQAMKEVN
jgi:hypothetical protein